MEVTIQVYRRFDKTPSLGECIRSTASGNGFEMQQIQAAPDQRCDLPSTSSTTSFSPESIPVTKLRSRETGSMAFWACCAFLARIRFRSDLTHQWTLAQFTGTSLPTWR